MNKAYRESTEFFCGRLHSTSYAIFGRNIRDDIARGLEMLEAGTRGICADARDTVFIKVDGPGRF